MWCIIQGFSNNIGFLINEPGSCKTGLGSPVFFALADWVNDMGIFVVIFSWEINGFYRGIVMCDLWGSHVSRGMNPICGTLWEDVVVRYKCGEHNKKI